MLSTRGRWTVPGDVASMPAWWSRMERAGLTYGGAWAVPGPRQPGIEQRSAYTAADHEHLPGLLLSVCSRPLAPRVRTGHRRAPCLHPPPSGQLTRLRFSLVHPPPGRRRQRGAAEDGAGECEQTTDADEDRTSDHESGVELKRPRFAVPFLLDPVLPSTSSGRSRHRPAISSTPL